MGGTGSGKWGARAPVEAALRLNIDEMSRSEALRRGKRHQCKMTWRNSYSGDLTGVLCLVANLEDAEHPTIRFVHRTGSGLVADYIVELTGIAQPFGGVRWWFRCPLTGDRVGTLVLPQGAAKFGSREAYQLSYRSQRSTPRDRAIAKMHRIKRKLGAEPSDQGPIDRPLGMHRATFRRRLDELADAETAAYAHLAPAIEALQRRLERGRPRSSGRSTVSASAV